MATKRICTLDEMRRLLLPSQLCTQLGWERGIRIAARIDESDKSVELLTSEEGELHLDGLNRITLDKSLCDKLGWGAGDVSISIDSTDTKSLIKLTQVNPNFS